jgi:hypothetical protein
MAVESHTASGRPVAAFRRKFPAAAWILVAMVLGILIGYAIFINFPDKKSAAQIAGYVSIVSDVFLRLIKMLIGPLVFSTLVVGIAHMGDAASVGRVFGKAIAWFITASLISLILGLVMANLLQPGLNLGCRCPTSVRRPTSRPPSSRSRTSSATSCPSRSPSDGQQRDPADRRVLDVLRRGAVGARRQGEDAGRRDRRAVARDAEDHRLRHEAGAAGRAGRDGGDGGRQRARDPRQVRDLHGRLLPRAVPAVGRARRGRFLFLGRACSACSS